MPVYDTADRLARLYALRARVDSEIATTEAEIARRARKHEAAQAQARLARLAPAPAVRAWARANGHPVSDVGKLSPSLREQYITATNQKESTHP